MMREEYKDHIDTYSVEGSWWLSKLTPKSKWGNISLAEIYLRKYWLSENEYNSKWKELHERIFMNLDVSLPDMVFKKGYELIPLRGGCLFSEKDFEQLKKSLLEIGEKYLVVIENTFRGNLKEPAFRMKYPVTISWKEIINGNFISSTIIENPNKEFFIFGETGVWGKYSASDYVWPLDIIGFKPECRTIFTNHFKQSNEEEKQINEWLPVQYQ
ncbi:hypothetical protein [Maribacter sp. 2304DJ31-5]|uniref:hypothetical protein n=1 Tax=Maribacter sp. 2304DJ31-5 TaxID=3386273 RepID=UPI0039BD74B2